MSFKAVYGDLSWKLLIRVRIHHPENYMMLLQGQIRVLTNVLISNLLAEIPKDDNDLFKIN